MYTICIQICIQYVYQYDKLTKALKKKIKVQNRPENVAIDLYFDEDEDDSPPMPSLEDDEKPEETC